MRLVVLRGVPEDVHWVITNLWLSAGKDRKVAGCYYASGEGEDRAYLIFLYWVSFRGWLLLRRVKVVTRIQPAPYLHSLVSKGYYFTTDGARSIPERASR